MCEYVEKRGGLYLSDELRFRIIKAMINEFPELREKVRNWLLENDDPESNDEASTKK